MDKKTLLVTQDFPPLVGGIANYYWNRVQKMPPEQVVVLMNSLGRLQVSQPAAMGAGYETSARQPRVYYKNFFTKLIWPHWLPLIWQVWKISRREKIDMIWVGQVLPVGTAVWLVVKAINFFRRRDPSSRVLGTQDDKKLKFFVTCHGNDLIRTRSVPRKYQLAKEILQAAEYVEANTEFTKSILIKDFSVPEEKVHIVYPECTLNKNQVDKEKIKELREKYKLHGKMVLLTVARLVKSKGVDRVIQALPKVLEQIPDLIYMVVGDGPDRDRLLEMAERLAPGSTWSRDATRQQDGARYEPGVNKRIIFIGNISRAELANYYALADAFILTPRDNLPLLTKEGIKGRLNDTESYGIVYLEAKEFDLPVIAGDVGGVREINYNKMILVNSEDVDEIANKIIKTLKH